MADDQRDRAKTQLALSMGCGILGIIDLAIALSTGRAWSYVSAAVLIGLPVVRLLRTRSPQAARKGRRQGPSSPLVPDAVFVEGRYISYASGDSEEATGLISVSRPPLPLRNRRRRYRIYVDGYLAGLIGVAETLDVKVVAGQHTVRARIDWTGSETVEVHVKPTETLSLWAEPSGSASAGLFQMLSPSGYIDLSEASN